MEIQNRHELYREFIEFVKLEVRKQRIATNRRMFHVFFWCFIVPAIAVASTLVLVKLGWIPHRFKNHTDTLILLFPVLYSIYYLGSEVFKDAPMLYRHGGVVNTLEYSLKEEKWRAEVCREIKQRVQAKQSDWAWIAKNFEIELNTIQFRIKYLTALGGAVFFLITKGLDLVSNEEQIPSFVLDPGHFLVWVEALSHEANRIIALGLFLVLLYLSGMQLTNNLERYLNCIRLIDLEATSEGKYR